MIGDWFQRSVVYTYADIISSRPSCHGSKCCESGGTSQTETVAKKGAWERPATRESHHLESNVNLGEIRALINKRRYGTDRVWPIKCKQLGNCCSRRARSKILRSFSWGSVTTVTEALERMPTQSKYVPTFRVRCVMEESIVLVV